MANEHEFQVWSAVGTCLNGIATARLGSGEQGLALIRKGVTSYQELKTVPVFFPLLI